MTEFPKYYPKSLLHTSGSWRRVCHSPSPQDAPYCTKDVLPKWRDRDARTISAREVIELLDGIVERHARVMANRTADILAQMFKYGIHRQIVQDSPVM